MALSVKLQPRQTQSLTLTPQLVQSIKLLQMSGTELLQHVADEVERNPLLELDDGRSLNATGETAWRERAGDDANATGAENASSRSDHETLDAGLAVSTDLDTSQHALEDKLDTTFDNEFDGDRSGGEMASAPIRGNTGSINGTDFSAGDGEGFDLEAMAAGAKSLQDHLAEQLALTRAEPAVRMLASQIIDALDDDGYLRRALEDIATEAGSDLEDARAALLLVQDFDPTGVGARDLGECLAIQLREKNHLDPAMECLLSNLELLARRDFGKLQQLCGVSFDDMMDMVDEIRALDPRPARAFDTAAVVNIIPDVFVNQRQDGSFEVELNPDAMPKVLVNQTYSSIVVRGPDAAEQKAFVAECLQTANWLVRSLEQRAQTILKVVTEIVRQQDGFFAYGVSHLRPMSLRQVADAIEMHESTVSRVTSNKYVQTRRGTFELKYFFTAAINATHGNDAHSAEAVRQRIRALIEDESAETVLSDDTIVDQLKGEGIDIARRTVAKYREAMGISSSVQRRREKRALARRR